MRIRARIVADSSFTKRQSTVRRQYGQNAQIRVDE
jgi:hypothetical protein